MKRATIVLLMLSLLIGTAVFSINLVNVNANNIVEKDHIESKNDNEDKKSLEITRDITYITSLEGNLINYSEEEAKKLVVEEEGYSVEELTVGYMNENIYLVNALNIEEGSLENLYLIVNGEIVDKKFGEDGQESKTFVESFEKYQEYDSKINQINEKINSENNEEAVMEYMALLVQKSNKVQATEYSVKKLNDSIYLVRCFAYENKQGLINEYIIENGILKFTRFNDENNESVEFEKILMELASK